MTGKTTLGGISDLLIDATDQGYAARLADKPRQFPVAAPGDEWAATERNAHFDGWDQADTYINTGVLVKVNGKYVPKKDA